MIINRKNIIKIICLIWILLWINFILRDLFHRGTFYDYKNMVGKDAEARRSYVYGDDLYEFLKFSKDKIPSSTTYDLVGVEDFSIEYRRSVYYLYPLLEDGDAEYLLVYNKPSYRNVRYKRFADLDRNRFILIRR